MLVIQTAPQITGNQRYNPSGGLGGPSVITRRLPKPTNVRGDEPGYLPIVMRGRSAQSADPGKESRTSISVSRIRRSSSRRRLLATPSQYPPMAPSPCRVEFTQWRANGAGDNHRDVRFSADSAATPSNIHLSHSAPSTCPTTGLSVS